MNVQSQKLLMSDGLWNVLRGDGCISVTTLPLPSPDDSRTLDYTKRRTRYKMSGRDFVGTTYTLLDKDRSKV